MLTAADWAARLATDGYAVIPEAVAPSLIERIARALDATFEAALHCDGDFYGRTTKRFGRLLLRTPETERLVRHAQVLKIVDVILRPWCDRFALNLTQAVEIGPGAPAQYPHRDQDMWAGPKGTLEYLVNVIWPLTPFSPDNGGTVLWPASHGVRHAEPTEPGDAISPTMRPGDALLFLGSTLHGGGANVTDLPRRGLIISYALGWLKPFENPWLAYPPTIARTFDPELAALIGYAIHRPNLGNFEGQCPSILLQDDVSEHLAAVDALLPEQARALAEHIAENGHAKAAD